MPPRKIGFSLQGGRGSLSTLFMATHGTIVLMLATPSIVVPEDFPAGPLDGLAKGAFVRVPYRQDSTNLYRFNERAAVVRRSD